MLLTVDQAFQLQVCPQLVSPTVNALAYDLLCKLTTGRTVHLGLSQVLRQLLSPTPPAVLVLATSVPPHVAPEVARIRDLAADRGIPTVHALNGEAIAEACGVRFDAYLMKRRPVYVAAVMRADDVKDDLRELMVEAAKAYSDFLSLLPPM